MLAKNIEQSLKLGKVSRKIDSRTKITAKSKQNHLEVSMLFNIVNSKWTTVYS